MSKTIKLQDKTYTDLEGLLRPRETFDEAVARLIEGARVSRELLDVLEGAVRFREGQLERLQKTAAAD